MAVYELTRKAENEIERIYDYSIVNFGLTVAHGYLVGLQECFQLLADHQSFGADYDSIKPLDNAKVSLVGVT